MEFEGKKVLVIGIARSGVAAINSLVRRGAAVTACDIKDRDQLGDDILNRIEKLGAVCCCGKYPVVDKDKFDIVVPSPGVPLDVEPVARARALDIPVMGEVELAYRIKSPDVNIYAITGTNGKTTTTSLLHFILQQDGRKAAAGGNIGVPLTGLIEQMPEGELATEISPPFLFIPTLPVYLILHPTIWTAIRPWKHISRLKPEFLPIRMQMILSF